MKKISVILLAFLVFILHVSSISAENKVNKIETKDKVIFTFSEKGKFLYSWSFDKNSYDKKGFEFDMGIKNKSLFEKKINKLTDKNQNKDFVSFNYHGNLPSNATIKLPVNSFKDGDRLNLYYYNDKTGKIETIKSNIMVSGGYVTFDITHCSDYFLTMSVVKNAEGANNNGVIIIGMLVVIVGLVGYTIFKNRNN